MSRGRSSLTGSRRNQGEHLQASSMGKPKWPPHFMTYSPTRMWYRDYFTPLLTSAHTKELLQFKGCQKYYSLCSGGGSDGSGLVYIGLGSIWGVDFSSPWEALQFPATELQSFWARKGLPFLNQQTFLCYTMGQSAEQPTSTAFWSLLNPVNYRYFRLPLLLSRLY